MWCEWENNLAVQQYEGTPLATTQDFKQAPQFIHNQLKKILIFTSLFHFTTWMDSYKFEGVKTFKTYLILFTHSTTFYIFWTLNDSNKCKLLFTLIHKLISYRPFCALHTLLFWPPLSVMVGSIAGRHLRKLLMF